VGSLPKASGLTGDLGGVRSLGQLVALLRPHFLPTSLARAPGATGSSGGRETVVTTEGDPASTASAGSAAALPATPAGYLPVQVNGVAMVVPYYKP